MTSWPENGIHHGIPFDIYRSDDITQRDTWETAQGKAVSKSLVTAFIEDARKWKDSVKSEPSESMRFGSLVDCLLLERDKFDTRYVVSEYTDFRTNAAKDWRFEMEDAGLQVITQDQHRMAAEAAKAVIRKNEAHRLLYEAQTQVAFRHKTRHGFAAKGLVDIVPTNPETLVDLKTCSHTALENRRSLQRHILDFGYHIQAGAYLDGWNIASGEERTRFKFIFVTNKPPFICAVVELPMPALLLGAQQYQSGVARFAECLRTDTWPSQWDGEVELDLPEWAYTESERGAA